ncbi:MAG TPA: ABC transporter permease [Thermoanaerobaculia bacterium]|nr:ABC transporter permease [Thermoanaerobaculia bacterium]
MFEGFGKDLRHALRSLRRSPGFTLAAVAALALGIGANTAIFSVVNAVLLEPLGINDADRVVLFVTTSPEGSTTTLSPAEFQHFQRQTSVEHAAAYSPGVVNYTGGGFPEQLRSARVTSEFFRCFRAPLAVGRSFTAAEDLPGAAPSVILSRSLWVGRFESDPAVIGRSMSIGGEPHEIVGVLGDFGLEAFGDSAQVFLPFPLEPGAADQTHYFYGVGRLAEGTSLAQANASVAASKQQYLDRFPGVLGENGGLGVEAIRDVLVQDARGSLAVLSGAVGLVLLIACGNVAHLLLARATGREREVALRTALGGSRRRIARQLLTESVVLSVLGGALGCVLGTAGIRALLAINTAGLPRIGDGGSLVDLDWRVLAFTLAISILTGLLFGSLPAWQTSRADLTTMLKESGGRTGSGFRHRRARAVMVVSEVALALVLLVGSALLIRTAAALQRVDPGFDVERTVTLSTSLAEPRFHTSEAVERLIRHGAEQLRALPGVEQASATCCVPLLGGYGLPFTIVGRPVADGPFHGGGAWTTISPGYFEVFRMAIVRGRTLTERDDGAAPPAVWINETMARRFWPDADPIGQRLVIGRGVAREFETEPEREIVGVVADTRAYLAMDPQPSMYIPQAQLPDAVNALNVPLTPLAWVVRTRTAPGPLAPAIQEELRKTTGLPVTDVQVMTEVVQSATSRQRFNMWLMTVFAGAALLLAAIGIYGLLAYSVEQRTHEIGVRVALGADAMQVRQMVVREGMRLALAGVAIGIAAAFALARSIAGFLYGVGAWDPVAFTVVPLVLIAVALIAVWLPARRASRVDPIVALRYE